jgi:hypothetical protein
MKRQILSKLALVATSLWLSSCDSQKVTGTMDETNASAARLLDTAGAPAAGANLLVFKPLDSTRTPVAAGVTLADGSYSLPTVPDGMYQILARSERGRSPSWTPSTPARESSWSAPTLCGIRAASMGWWKWWATTIQHRWKFPCWDRISWWRT